MYSRAIGFNGFRLVFCNESNPEREQHKLSALHEPDANGLLGPRRRASI